MQSKIFLSPEVQKKLQHKKLVLAISGGADSMAMLHLFATHAEWCNNFLVVHIQHGLRENDFLDADCVKDFCVPRSIPFYVKKLDPSNRTEASVENWARKYRYQYLEEIRSQEKADWILTAHHAQDQAETMVHRLMRGTGLRGLQGIHTVDLQRKIIRPLLHLSPNLLKAHLQSQKVNWVEDPSNAETEYTRNQIRHQALPKLNQKEPQFQSQLVSLAQKTQAVWPQILAWSQKVWSEHTQITEPNCLQIQKNPQTKDLLQDYDEHLGLYVEELLRQVGAPSLNQHRFGCLLQAFGQSNARWDWGKGWILQSFRSHISLTVSQS